MDIWWLEGRGLRIHHQEHTYCQDSLSLFGVLLSPLGSCVRSKALMLALVRAWTVVCVKRLASIRGIYFCSGNRTSASTPVSFSYTDHSAFTVHTLTIFILFMTGLRQLPRLTCTIINSHHQEPVSGQACNPPDPHPLFFLPLWWRSFSEPRTKWLRFLHGCLSNFPLITCCGCCGGPRWCSWTAWAGWMFHTMAARKVGIAAEPW